MSTANPTKIRRLKLALLDSLFPVFCLSCQKEGAWICQHCLGQMEILDFQVCPACENKVTDHGSLCPNCRENRKSRLSSLIAATSYENPTVKKMVHYLKYRFIGDISLPLSKLIAQALIRSDFPLPDFLAPVPLHPKRLRWRGFNQSLLLAENICEEMAPLLNIEVLDILERKRHNPPQMSVKNYRERLENVKDIFGLKEDIDGEVIKNKNILIIDDIATTGSTLEECAKVLKSAGAKKVSAVVVARQNLKK